MEGDKPSDPKKKTGVVEGPSKASLREIVSGDDGDGARANILELARQGKIDFEKDIPATTKQMLSEGKNPIELLAFLKDFIGRSLEDLEEKVNAKNRDTDSPN